MLIWTEVPRVVASLQPWAEVSQRLRRICIKYNRIVLTAMSMGPVLNETEIEALYAEFVDEDHNLSEEDIESYAKSLTVEDVT